MNRTFFFLIHCHNFKMGPQREKEMKFLKRHGLSPWYIKSNQDAKRAVNELSAYLFFFFPPHIQYMKSLTLCPVCCQVELCSIYLFPCIVLEINQYWSVALNIAVILLKWHIYLLHQPVCILINLQHMNKSTGPHLLIFEFSCIKIKQQAITSNCKRTGYSIPPLQQVCEFISSWIFYN